MSMLLLDDFNRSRTRDTLASRGSRADTHYHIVTTFEAKESGVPGVQAQSLGISGRVLQFGLRGDFMLDKDIAGPIAGWSGCVWRRACFESMP